MSTSMADIGEPSPVPSEMFAGFSLLAMAIVVLLMLRHYLPLRKAPAFLLVPVFFALFLPAAMVLLVPIDLASSAKTDDVDARGIWLEKRPLLVSWRITYWLTFSLTWFILPILAEYSDSGYRDPKEKVLDSLQANAQYYGLMLGSAVIGFVYVVVNYGQVSESLKSTAMALAYCWGLVQAIYLMGHGLVSMPRRMIRNASVSDRLRWIQSRAPAVFEAKEDAETSLDEVEMQVFELSKRKSGSAREFQDWVEELVEITKLSEEQPPSTIISAEERARALPTVITEKFMADLTRRLLRANHARSRYASEWKQLMQDAVEAQAILDSAASRKLEFGRPSPTSSGFLDSITVLTPYTRYLLHYHIMPVVRLTFGGLLAVASFCIVWSEVVKSLLPRLSIIRYSVVHHWNGDKGQVGFAGQVIAVLWMMYMCTSALYSITEVKVWRGRALVKRNTAHESAFWYAGLVARLSIPLSYNFMTFLGGAYTDTVFYNFLGKLINLTPLGKWFDFLFPTFILVPVCATLFGWYSKVQRLLGFGHFVMDDGDGESEGPAGFSASSYGSGSWREGRDLIERELNGQSAAIRRRRLVGEGDDENGNGTTHRASGTLGSGRATPVLSVPHQRDEGIRGSPATPLGTSPNARPQANTSARRIGPGSRRGGMTDDDDEDFFGNLGHRLKNTLETLEPPKWWQGLKKPRWMEDDEPGEGSRTAEGGGPDVRRWFGQGQPGRIRL